MYKKIILLTASLTILLTPVFIFAEENDLTEDEAKVEEKKRFETDGEIKIGVQQVDENKGDSAKFNEYRDREDGFYLYKFSVESVDNASGRYLEFKGSDVGRKDQEFRFKIGGPGKWGVEFEWDETPHNLSNKAKTPYSYQGSGLYTVPGNAGITSTTASTAQDTLVSNFLNSGIHSTDLGTKRKSGRIALAYTATSRLKFKLEYSDEKKEGTQLTGAQIGDRPPRSLVVQLQEPVDYQTKDLKLEAEYNGKNFQATVSHLISEFNNNVDSLTWQSMFYGADEGADYNTITGTTYSTYGKMALAPDNRYQNTALSMGINLPLGSRLTATASVGMMKQDEDLLPYSYSSFGVLAGAPGSLPRSKADAEIKTTRYNIEYSVNPIDSTSLHAFYRHYDLDNNTTQSQWQYETSDTLTSDTGLSLNNKRVNLAYAYRKDNYGLDLSHTLPAKLGTVGLGYEKEKTDRDYREANTTEDTYKASYRVMPLQWLSLKAKYLQGKRKADGYNGEVTDLGYWYTLADPYGSGSNTKDNPVANFSNSPDLRKSDVSDRDRKQWNVSAFLKPLSAMDLNLSYMQRKDDFDSGVLPTAVAGYNSSTAAITSYNTVGQQLGLLENKANQYSAGVNYAPTEKVTLSASYGRDENESMQRGIGASEDNKFNGTGWTDPTKLWTAKTTDNTDITGVGFGIVIIPNKLNLATDYTYSYGTVDIDYEGYGNDQVLNASSYGFTDPTTVSHKQQTINATVEYKAAKGIVVGLGYMYDKYETSDWMQEPNGGWVEQAGSEYYLRDSNSADYTRWGNRLVSMGSYLGPAYENHVATVTLAYKW